MKNRKTLSSKDVIKIAEQNGFNVKYGNGSHFKIENPYTNECMTCNHTREISIGVSSKIIKWFAKAGIILSIIVGIPAMLYLSWIGVF